MAPMREVAAPPVRGPRHEDRPEDPRRRSPADRFRPDLEGLRAVAVVLVLLYHARVPGFGGGYVGVDVFFVLSGFLITGLIVRELRDTGTVSLPAFYARRARRLLPAAALVLVVTVAVSAWVLPPLLVPDVAADGLAAALYASNLRFAFGATDYLAADVDPSPLLHYWSLGVEEQFYLFWPALLLLVASRTRAIARPLAITAAVVLVVSLVLSIWLTDAAAPWAFFSLPARAWELAIGALIALGAVRLASLPVPVGSAAVWLGLGMVTASALVIDPSTPFPGIAALLPVGGAALVILGGLREPIPLPSRLLSVQPARYLGRISYSLYLWHWPMIVLPAAALETRLPVIARLALVLLAVVAAAASHRWVEEPIRHGRVVGRRPRPSLAAAGALTLVVASVSVALGGGRWLAPPADAASIADPVAAVERDGLDAELDDVLGAVPSPGQSSSGASAPTSPSPGTSSPPATPGGPVPADLRPPLAEAKESVSRIYDDGCMLTYGPTTPGECTYGDRSSETTVVLFGDSHVGMWFPAFDRLARERGWRLVVFSKAACSAVDLPVYTDRLKREYTECKTWRDLAMARIDRLRPALVVLSHSHRQWLQTPGGGVPVAERPAAWRAGLESSLRRLDDLAGGVVLIGNTPILPGLPPVCLSKHPDDMLACAHPRAEVVPLARIETERRVAAAAGITFIDPTAWICPSDPCPVVIGRILVYRDSGHLTTIFSAALASRIEASLPAL
jgi:peptidoglycan/LPS O-acetylase OafA/YrhL